MIETNPNPFVGLVNKGNYRDHINYKWRLENPYQSLLDYVYVEVPFRVSVSTGDNPILVPGANDPFVKSFKRKHNNVMSKTDTEASEKEEGTTVAALLPAD